MYSTCDRFISNHTWVRYFEITDDNDKDYDDDDDNYDDDDDDDDNDDADDDDDDGDSVHYQTPPLVSLGFRQKLEKDKFIFFSIF